MSQQYTNLAVSTLAANYTAGNSTIQVASSTGSRFPASGNFTLGFNDPPTFFLQCTGRSGDTLTVTTSGTEGTTATNVSSGAIVQSVLSAAVLDGIRADINVVGPYASLPTSGMKSGDTYRCTDSVYTFVYTGSIWQAFVGEKAVTVPPTTWGQENCAYWDNSHGYIIMSLAPAAGTNGISCTSYQTAPSTPYTAKMLHRYVGAFGPGSNWVGSGMVLRDSTGKLISFCRGSTSGSFFFNVDYWTNYAVWTSDLYNVVNIGAYDFLSGDLWMAIQDDGTNLNFKYSVDGNNWKTWQSGSRTAWLSSGPTQVGFIMAGIYGYGDAMCLSWSVA